MVEGRFCAAAAPAHVIAIAGSATEANARALRVPWRVARAVIELPFR